MSFSLNINLGSVSPTITSVRLLACTGSTCDNGTVISGYDDVLVSTFPRIVTSIPDGTTYIKVEALGACPTSQCITISGLSGTPTPTPIPNTPTPTPNPSSTTYSPINFSVSPSCVGYAPTGVTITISGPSGGSGTGYYVVMTSPDGLDSTHYSLPHSYTGLNNYVGNTYAFSVFDSVGNSGNKALTQDFGCASAPNNTANVRLVISSIKPTLSDYNSASSYWVDLGSPSATFCNASTFTNSSFQNLGTGNNYWLCYDDGSSKQTRQVFHPSNAGYFQQAGGCQTIT